MFMRESHVDRFTRDDPIDKYLPDFSPPLSSYGWSRHLANFDGPTLVGKERLTLLQAASHLSGKLHPVTFGEP